jgi:hypothetical protein
MQPISRTADKYIVDGLMNLKIFLLLEPEIAKRKTNSNPEEIFFNSIIIVPPPSNFHE